MSPITWIIRKRLLRSVNPFKLSHFWTKQSVINKESESKCHCKCQVSERREVSLSAAACIIYAQFANHRNDHGFQAGVTAHWLSWVDTRIINGPIRPQIDELSAILLVRFMKVIIIASHPQFGAGDATWLLLRLLMGITSNSGGG